MGNQQASGCSGGNSANSNLDSGPVTGNNAGINK